jgi:hypothetical protein
VGVTLSPEPKAAVDISGAAEQWPNYGALWEAFLTPMIIGRKMPIFFLQPQNENRIDPTIQFSSLAARFGDHEFQAALFPPVHPYPGRVQREARGLQV